jgi:ribosomal protein L11 methyltransferase
MLELFPDGFEEREGEGWLELAAYSESDESAVRATFSRVAVSTVAEDWADRWRDFHRAVRIGPLWVGPPWLEAPSAAIPVVIDPGRAFGTGAHPTTQLCLELLLEVEPGSLLDVGCGSGVLAIAAAKLGFGPVTALDHEEAATDAASRNADRNGVRIAVVTRDALADDPLPEAEVTVANIALEAIRSLAPNVRSPRFIASGYLARDDPRPPGFRPEKRLEREGWAADSYARE